MVSLENEASRIGHAGYYLPKVAVKDYNVMIYGKKTVRNDIKNILKHFKNCCQSRGLLYYPYFKKYKFIAINFIKQKALGADQKQ